MPPRSAVYRFGPFLLDPAERLLLRSGQPVSVTPKAFDLLVYLVEHHGRLVTKQELMDALWPSTFVEEANLTYTVSTLRKALADGHNGEPLIQTVPTRGYRFVATVTTEGAVTRELPVASEVPDVPIGAPPASRAVQRPIRPLVLGTALLACVAAATLFATGLFRQGTHPELTAWLSIPLPEISTALYGVPVPQISPDGRRLALLVTSGSAIWLRDLHAQTSRPLAGTDDARSLFWSPDGKHLAFTTSSALKTLRLSDGLIQVVCDACEPAGGGTWSSAGHIVFPARSGGLHVIAPGARHADVLTRIDRRSGEVAHRAPSFLPDGQHLLYVIRNSVPRRSGLYVGRVDAAERRLLVEGEASAVFALPGYLLFVAPGGLMARPFDPARLAFTGPPQSLVQAEFLQNELGGQPAFSASHTGVLTYADVDRPHTQFQWFGRNGTPEQLVGRPGVYYTFDLSDDGKRLAYVQIDKGNAHVWVLDLERGVPSPITSGSGFYADPRWAAGGTLVATRWQPLPPAIVRIGHDGAEAVIASTRAATMVDDVAGDADQLLYRDPSGQLLATSVFDGGPPRHVRTAPSGNINQGRLSPDGRWVAYQEADERGHFNVFASPFPPTGERWQVSAGGAVQPVWRADGRELYYLALDGTLTAVGIRSDVRQPFSAPTPLFTSGLVPPAPTVEEYAVASDGQRFLLLRPLEDRVRSNIGVISNWPALLRVPVAAP